MLKKRFQLPRLFGWLIATVLLLAFIGALYPQQFPVSLYKLSLVTLAGVVGYWLDRDLFPYARPDCFMPGQLDCIECGEACFPQAELVQGEALVEDELPASIAFAAAMLRRAIIVGCAMLAMGLGA